MNSKNRTEDWGYCTDQKKQEKYKECGSIDDQSWHLTVRECGSNCKRMYVLERLFLQLIKENLTKLDKFPPLYCHKILNPTFLSPPTKISIKKKKFPHKRFLWSFGPSPLFTKGEGRKLCGKTERNERAGSCILAVKRKGEFECICQKRKICVVSERSGSCILNIFIRSMFKTRNTMEKGHIFFFGFWLELSVKSRGQE